MVPRTLWIDRIEAAWKRKTVLWLAGVRRVGKSMLAASLPDVLVLDCELPRVRSRLADPERFLETHGGRRIVLDEVHRLENPSETLKIAADHFPNVRVLATGSSTLTSSRRFRDTLTGRKENLWLTPLCRRDRHEFDAVAAPAAAGEDRRYLHGGLPSFYLATSPPQSEFVEWLDGYWSRDVETLFRLERREAFMRLAELLFAQSGAMFEATRFAVRCEASRPTISNYLAVLEATFLVHIVRPWSSRSGSEIVSAPRVYGFDTGFVCFYKGWDRLRDEDRGLLHEHLVLNELHAHFGSRRVHYWRDKRGHEVDFVVPRHGAPLLAIECKHSESAFDPTGFHAFTARHEGARLLCVTTDTPIPHRRRFRDLEVSFVSLRDLEAEIRRDTGERV